MKKILAVVLALAMVLSMTVSSFAAAPLPTNTEADWAEYFTDVYTSDFLDAEAQANALVVSVTMTNDVDMLLRALKTAMNNAEAAGVDTTETNLILADILAEHGLNLEQGLNEDIDGDGYLGDPAEGIVYVPTDPTDVEAWTTYYVIILGEASTNPAAVVTVVPEIAGNVINGDIDMDTFTSAFPEAAKIVGGDVVNQIVWGVEDLLSTDLNSDGYIGKPDGNIDDGKLPEEDEDNTSGGSDMLGGLLDTVLGVLGTIGDLLFGGSGEGGNDTPPTQPNDDNDPWGDDGDDALGDDSSSTIPDTGDTTVFAVAAVALAAGAALVMTRKKSEDAE